VNHPPILLGTSSFTASGWNGSFYPRGMKPSGYLAFYAERFRTVGVDSTFYACPTASTVQNWNARTPDGFIFSVKVPQTITHDKVLVNCDAEAAEFLEVMDTLGGKLGPIVFQFRFFVLIYAYANNHFQGHGPATIAKFLEMWAANGFGKTR
jgi:uncharacterized protein YecE (DUF72 family)